MTRPRLAPHVHLASVPGRARADAWPLVLMVVVVALGVGLVALAPRLVLRTEHDAVASAVRTQPDRAAVVVSHPIEQVLPDSGGRDVVDQVTDIADRLDASVAQTLPGMDAHGTRALLSRSLPLTDVTDPRGVTTLRLGHVAHDGGPGITWTDGRAPGGWDGDGPVRVVEVGLSEDVAAFLGVGPGDLLPTPVVTTGPTQVRVAGVFRAEDPGDPAWAPLPQLLAPAPRGDEVVLSTAVGALCTDASFPDAFAALPPETFAASYTYRADPDAVADAGADVVTRAAGAVLANAAGLDGAMWAEVRTDLPDVLAEVSDQVGAARAQAAVLVGAVGAGAVLTTVLAAALLVTRRSAVLAQYRARGGSLAAIALELLVESVPVTAVGAGLGLLAASVVAPGPVPWVAGAPILVAAVAGAPLLGARAAAHAAGGRRAAANRRRRQAGRGSAREQAREQALRRVVIEATVLVAAVGATLSAHARDVADGGAVLVAAPVLVAVAGALLVARALPALLAARLVLARRSRHAVPLLAAGRSRAATRPLALVVLTSVVALGAFAATVARTVDAGREQASWDAVGADVTAVTRPDVDLATVTAGLAGAPGVDAATAVRAEEVQFRSTWGAVSAHLVAADSAGLQRFVRLTPVGGPDAARLAGRLGPATQDGAIPALVSGDLLAHGRQDLGVRWSGTWLPVVAVGPAPAVDGRHDGLVVVDLAALDAAVTGPVTPNTVWAVGPGATAAVQVAPELRDAQVVSRQAWLGARRGDPLASGVTASTTAGAVLLGLLAALVVVLAAAAGAPDRGRTLATLRAVGVASRQAWRIALGEVGPPALVASVAGVLLGIGTAQVLGGALDLRLVTGQAQEPAVVVGWWAAVPVVLLALVVVAVVTAEAAVRRRERLGDVLRAG